MSRMAVRRKVHVDGVPFTEVALSDGSSVRLYDTSGPGGDPAAGLPPFRREWILGRGDVETYEGRPGSRRDDGRAASRRAEPAPSSGPAHRPPLRAKQGRTVT